MRVWHISGLLAAVLLLMRLALILPPRNGVPPSSQTVYGTTIGLIVCVFITVVSYVSESRSRRHERSGPVAPVPANSIMTVAPGSRWPIQDVAAVIAGEFGEFTRPYVSVDERSRTIRIVLDPPSWVYLNTSLVSNVRRDSSGKRILHHRGQWIVLTLRPGKPPRLRLRKGLMDARRLSDGRLGLLWGWRSGRWVSRRRTTQAVLHEERSHPASFSITTDELAARVDAVAVRGGWVSPEALQARRASDLRPQVWSVSRGGSQSFSTPTTASSATGAQTHTHDDAQTTFDTSTTSLPNVEEFLHARRRATQGIPGLGGIAQAARWVAIAVLVVCVIATVIGLLAGMVWWAGLIIIGGGVLFALIFTLPLFLIARSGTGRSR